MLPPASGETYVQAAKLYRTGRKRGVTIRSLVDCLFAAIAMEHGAVILHKDRDYERISEYAPLKTIPGNQ
jgi:predicted nucleic acid-binding protein